ncbi:MAG: TetR/AcrR family transcriptional regulator [Pseudomonadota bacterium]
MESIMTKREAILVAATDLFARKGYKNTATSEIAELANVAQGTVFHHFKSKENLLISICDDLVNTYISGIRKAADSDGKGLEAIEKILDFYREFKKHRYNSIAVAFKETQDVSRAGDEVHRHFQDLISQIIDIKAGCIERGIADGSIRSVPVYPTALMIHFLLMGQIHSETEGLLEVSNHDNELLEFCRRSIAAEESIPKCQEAGSGG